MIDKQWYDVKAYDEGTRTTTTLSKYASSIEEIQEDMKEDEYWIFVDAKVSEHQ